MPSKKEQIEELRHELEELKRALHASISSILVVDHNSVIHFVNKEWEKTTGFTSEELLGKNLSTLFDDLSFIDRTKTEGQILEEIKGKKADGTDFWIWCRVSIAQHSAEDQSDIVFAAQDITSEKQQDLELQKRTSELEKMNSVMIDRELKMIELKKKIKKLEENC